MVEVALSHAAGRNMNYLQCFLTPLVSMPAKQNSDGMNLASFLILDP